MRQSLLITRRRALALVPMVAAGTALRGLDLSLAGLVWPASAAHAAPGRPDIITRQQWGADESIRRGEPRYSEPLLLAVVHHTATPNTYSPSQSPAVVRSIYSSHVRANGWDDIGYNFLIDRYGRIFEGRAGGIDRTVTGAHARGFNEHSVGVAMIGDYRGSKPPEPAMQALKNLLAWRLDLGLVDPRGSTAYVSRGNSKWPAGRTATLRNVCSHRDVVDTACPGSPIQGALAWAQEAAYLTGLPKMFEARLSPGVLVSGVTGAVALSARFSEARSWKAEILGQGGAVQWSRSSSGVQLGASWNGRDQSGAVVPHDTYRVRISAPGIRPHELPLEVWRWPNGTFFVTSGDHSYILLGGRLRPPASAQTLRTWYGWGEHVPVTHDVLKHYPMGPPLGFRDGSVVRGMGWQFIISRGFRRPVSTSALGRLGFDPQAVIDASDKDLSVHPAGDPVRASDGYPVGVALRGSGGQEAEVRPDGVRWFASPAARRSRRIRDVDLAGPADDLILASAAAPRRGFREGSLVRAPGGQIFVIAGGRRNPISDRSFRRMGYQERNVRGMGAIDLLAHSVGEQL